MRPWVIAEDQVKVAASAGPVEVAFSLRTWLLAPVITGLGGDGRGRERVIRFARAVRRSAQPATPFGTIWSLRPVPSSNVFRASAYWSRPKRWVIIFSQSMVPLPSISTARP